MGKEFGGWEILIGGWEILIGGWVNGNWAWVGDSHTIYELMIQFGNCWVIVPVLDNCFKRDATLGFADPAITVPSIRHVEYKTGCLFTLGCYLNFLESTKLRNISSKSQFMSLTLSNCLINPSYRLCAQCIE